MAYTLDTTLGTLLDDPKAKEVMEKHLPGATNNPMIGMAKGMSLNSLLSLPQAAQMGVTKEKVQSMLNEINKRI